MRRRFSKRYGYDPDQPQEPILEGAPSHARLAYSRIALGPLLFIDGDSRYPNDENKPIGIKALYEDLAAICRAEGSDAIWDSWQCHDILIGEIGAIPWYHFYDVVEHVGQQLIRQQSDDPFSELPQEFSFEIYRERVNRVFEDADIGWRLAPDGSLVRFRPAALERRMNATEADLTDDFEPARAHYRKAVRYLYERPLDPENSVKEIVSAVESAARVLYPGSSTLGTAVKAMRAEARLPAGLVSTIEKYYAFASGAPAVRHGSPHKSTLRLEEAELSLHIGIAIIRYLVSRVRPNEAS